MTRIPPTPFFIRRYPPYAFVVWASYGIYSTVLMGAGPLFPTIASDLMLTPLQLGVITAALPLGMVPSLFGGLLSDRIGRKRGMAIGYAVEALGLLSLSFSNSFLGALSSLLFAGLGASMFNPAANSAVSDFFPTKKGFALNILHVFFGVGAMIGPLTSGAIVNFLGSWRLGFQVFSLLIMITIIPILALPTGLPPPSRRRSLEGATMMIRSKVILFLSLATFLQLAAEYAIGMWLVYFFVDFRGFTAMESSIILGSMGGTFIPGRLFWSKYMDRIGYVKTLGLCAALSSTLLTVSLLSPSMTLTMVIFPAASFFISATVPAGLAMAASEFPKASGAAIGSLYLLGAVGGALGPFTVGAVSETSTTLLGILTIPLFLALISVVALGLRRAGMKRSVELLSPPVRGVE